MANMNLKDALDRALRTTKQYIDQNEFSGDYNDLENRPCYDDRNTVFAMESFEDSLEDILISIEIENWRGAIISKISDFVPDIESVKSGSVYISFDEMMPVDAGYYNISDLEEVVINDNLYLYGYKRNDSTIYGALLIALDNINTNQIINDDDTGENASISKGIWFICSQEQYITNELIYGKNGELKQLDEKFIPDTIARVEDVNILIEESVFSGDYNDLENKPCYDITEYEGIYIEITESTEFYKMPLVKIQSDPSYGQYEIMNYRKISNVTQEDIDYMMSSENGFIQITAMGDPTPLSEAMSYNESYGIYDIMFPFFMISATSFTFEGVDFSAGIWVFESSEYYSEEDGSLVHSMERIRSYGNTIIDDGRPRVQRLKKLEDKFIPDTIATKEYVSSVSLMDFPCSLDGKYINIYGNKLQVGGWYKLKNTINNQTDELYDDARIFQTEEYWDMPSHSLRNNNDVVDRFCIFYCIDRDENNVSLLRMGPSATTRIDIDWVANTKTITFVNNVNEFVPTEDYNFVNKKYVDDQIVENKFSGDYNDLENRPCYDDRIPEVETTIVFDGNTTGKETVPVNSQGGELFTLVKMTDKPIAFEEFYSTSLVNFTDSTGELYSYDLESGYLASFKDTLIVKQSDDLFYLDELGVYVVCKTSSLSDIDEHYDEGIITPGIWFMIDDDRGFVCEFVYKRFKEYDIEIEICPCYEESLETITVGNGRTYKKIYPCITEEQLNFIKADKTNNFHYGILNGTKNENNEIILYEETFNSFDSYPLMENDGYYNIGEYLLFAYEDFELDTYTFTKGIWALSYEGLCHRLSLKITSSFKQLDEKFIPDTIARIKDVNILIEESVFSGDYNDLENRPCYDDREFETVQILCDGNFEGKEVLEEMPYAKIADLNDNDIDCILSNGYKAIIKLYEYDENDELVLFEDLVSYSLRSVIGFDGLYCAKDDELIMIAVKDITDPISISKGLWVFNGNTDTMVCTYDISYDRLLSGELKQLDGELLPEGLPYDNREFEEVKLVIDENFDITGKETVVWQVEETENEETVTNNKMFVKLYDSDFDVKQVVDEGLLECFGQTFPANYYCYQAEEFYSIMDQFIVAEEDGTIFTKGIWGLYSVNEELYYNPDEDDLISLIFKAVKNGELHIMDSKFVPYKPGLVLEKGTKVTPTIWYINEENGVYGTVDEEYPVGKGAEIFNDYHTNVDDYSYALVNRNIAIGDYSHAEGRASYAKGHCSHTEGDHTYAAKECTHAEGYFCQAVGENSHAEGQYTQALGKNQHVQGILNIPDTNNKYAHIVGNGISENGENITFSNAHTLDWDGNAWYQGNVSVDGTPTNDNDLTTKKYVDDTIANVTPELITEEDINAIIADIDN